MPCRLDFQGVRMKLAWLRCGALVLLVLCLGQRLKPQNVSPPGAPSPAASLNSSRPLTLEERADIAMARKRYDLALDLLQEAARQQPRDAMLWNKIGIAYHQLNELPQAQKAYRQALKLNPRMPEATNNLGAVYFAERKDGKAAKQFKKAIKLQGNVSAYYVNLGAVEFNRNHMTAARQSFLQALKLDPDALNAGSRGGTVVKFQDMHDPARYHFLLARLYSSLGRVEDALHQFRQAQELHYAHLRDALKDDAFAPLRALPEFQRLMPEKR